MFAARSLGGEGDHGNHDLVGESRQGPAASHTRHGSPLMPCGLCAAEPEAGQERDPEPATNATSQS